MTKHTPGPWEIDIHSPDNCFCYMIRDTQGGESEDEAIANASLIAAAPDMLAALKSLQEYAYECLDDIAANIQEGGGLNSDELRKWTAVIEAINKAENNPYPWEQKPLGNIWRIS